MQGKTIVIDPAPIMVVKNGRHKMKLDIRALVERQRAAYKFTGFGDIRGTWSFI